MSFLRSLQFLTNWIDFLCLWKFMLRNRNYFNIYDPVTVCRSICFISVQRQKLEFFFILKELKFFCPLNGNHVVRFHMYNWSLKKGKYNLIWMHALNENGDKMASEYVRICKNGFWSNGKVVRNKDRVINYFLCSYFFSFFLYFSFLVVQSIGLPVWSKLLSIFQILNFRLSSCATGSLQKH